MILQNLFCLISHPLRKFSFLAVFHYLLCSNNSRNQVYSLFGHHLHALIINEHAVFNRCNSCSDSVFDSLCTVGVGRRNPSLGICHIKGSLHLFIGQLR